MRHARLVESQAGIKTGGKNNSNLRYADNTTLMAGKKKKNNLKSLLIRVKEESKRAGLRLYISISIYLYIYIYLYLYIYIYIKTKIMGIHQVDPKAVSYLGLKFSKYFLIDFRLGEQERLVRGHGDAVGLPRCLTGKEHTCQCRRQGFDP